nr:MAG TPA: hypothetical protein [Caudoviricetes sp.]
MEHLHTANTDERYNHECMNPKLTQAQSRICTIKILIIILQCCINPHKTYKLTALFTTLNGAAAFKKGDNPQNNVNRINM